MPISGFHPIVSRWFAETLGKPTIAQRRGWAAIRERQHTLIAAPTGSGKTLAAFLTALDDLVQEGLHAPLPDEVRVVYVSPLKALSADIHKNLAEPRRGLRRMAEADGLLAPRITAAVRTGDTSQAERAAMLRTPPHILVTTPESLYLLLTAAGGREMLRTARTVIVDEIHAVIGTRRGAHLALSLERLDGLAERPLVRLGLSATQKPIEDVARYLVAERPCTIVNEGHRREMDLSLELPRSPLEAVMSHEVWAECYARLTELIQSHRTTLVFVNTRRMAERVARQLGDALGDDQVTAHHGSLSKERRLDAEHRLKSGSLKALVATASLELGIDIGHVDLVCQIGSPHRIATLLQRVGRSGHTIAGLPKGRVFPTTRDDLIECAALLRAVAAGDLDRIVTHDAPLDVLAQQIVAETAARELTEDELFDLVRRAWPYRALERPAFDGVVAMVSEGFTTRRGRRGALVHRDEVHHRVRGRRGAGSLAITSGGAIPEVADYRVMLDPEDQFIGTINEDFAIESTAGDVFQLGNASWRILQVGAGVVRVADAKGAPPTLPFWLGEAPARSDELSRAVSQFRADIDRELGDDGPPRVEAAIEWLSHDAALPEAAATQAAAYLAETRQALGCIPTQDRIVLERFFDESGGMQLVLHAPFGSRVNRAWGLALRKRFCRQFNFELQAAATEDALVLSLGPQHSFPLADVFRYLHPATVANVLLQAFLDAPVFQTRWRWNTTISLAVPRNRHGKKIPPQLQRMRADDLLAAVFPDAAACLENIPGDREVPDHPLVNQTVRDCFEEAMDLPQLTQVLTRIHEGRIVCVARDTPEPSPLAHEVLNARPYAFLDDAPLEERRTQAVYTRRASDPATARDLGALDAAAIARVCDEVRPDPRDADELHDALVTAGFLTLDEVAALPAALLEPLTATGRCTRVLTSVDAGTSVVASAVRGLADAAVWSAAERLPEILALHPSAPCEPQIVAPASRAARTWSREEALVALLRSRLAVEGPTTAARLAGQLGVREAEIDGALLALEADGAALRGRFRAPSASDGVPDEIEWCDRTLVARIHRYTLNRLRAEIEPVSPADFMRFLFAWHHVLPDNRLHGVDGLRAAIATLDGFELAAGAWERTILPSRLAGYDPATLDSLCLAGEVGWLRRASLEGAAGAGPDAPAAVTSATPVALVLRDHLEAWQMTQTLSREAVSRQAMSGTPLSSENTETHPAIAASMSETAQRVLDRLTMRGAAFFRDLASALRVDAATLSAALGRLAAAGLVTSDSFAGLRSLLQTATERPGRHPFAGRWSAVDVRAHEDDDGSRNDEALDAALETQARTFLRRYGVVSRRLLTREACPAPWRQLLRVYRRLEARGEIRGGRFVSGWSGEQFAMPDAVERLREVRRSKPDDRIVVISAVDPLNLCGIADAGERVRATAPTRIAYRHGVALAVLEGDYLHPLATIDQSVAADVASSLAGRPLPATVVSGYIGR